MERHPPWLRVRLPGEGRYYEVRKQLKKLAVHTVCEEARCPNAAECWGSGTATFMVLGEVCTRGCRFCNVATGQPNTPPDPDEPRRVTEAASALGLGYIVITSVDRDDLVDGGAGHYAEVVRAVHERLSTVIIEVLTPDFAGDANALSLIATCGAHVLGHNIETTRSLTPRIRDHRCDYHRSLEVLETFKRQSPHLITKSSLLLGLGETEAQILETMQDLRSVGVDWITAGQYLQPTKHHTPVQRYIPPEEFQHLEKQAQQMGFPLVAMGPLVRSSYRAGEAKAETLLCERSALLS